MINNENNTALSRSELMNQIQMYGFAALEANLFLDTHPECKEALRYYLEVNNIREKLQDEYAHKYGPIRTEDEIWEEFNWISSPWPWELEGQ